MKASETTVKALLDGQKQYVVPLFQRTYRWDKKHWEVLWQDLCEVYKSTTVIDHFLGSIVTVSGTAPPESPTPYTLIDGQQRLTTLCILLAALRDTARQSHVELSERLHGLYLTNHFVKGLDQLKVMPTQADRDAFAHVMNSTDRAPDSRIAQAYRFFLKSIAAGVDNGAPIDLERLKNAVLDQLSLVSISLSKEDNPYRIFESLNYKGLILTQSDLLRNYFFMRLPVLRHEDLYHRVWRPMEDLLGKAMDDFIRDFFVKDRGFVRENDVYQRWKKEVLVDSLSAEEIQAKMEELGRFGHYYHMLIEPDQEPEATVRKALNRLKRWGGTTAYPLLLNLYDDVERQRLTKAGLARILAFIESFLVRRTFANIPTNALNRIFIRLYSEAQPLGREDLVDAIWLALSSPGHRWPSNDEFQESMLTYPLYIDSRPEQRRLILEALEERFDHKEPVVMTGLSVEHVMPQHLTGEWRKSLGDRADNIHRKYLHTLPNLTLIASKYNEKLSNNPFRRKQELYDYSHLELNREIAQESTWGEGQILERARRLSARALEIWPGPKELDGAS